MAASINKFHVWNHQFNSGSAVSTQLNWSERTLWKRKRLKWRWKFYPRLQAGIFQVLPHWVMMGYLHLQQDLPFISSIRLSVHQHFTGVWAVTLSGSQPSHAAVALGRRTCVRPLGTMVLLRSGTWRQSLSLMRKNVKRYAEKLIGI